MIFDLAFQIAGAIVLVYGIAIRKRKEIIESSARPGILVYDEVLEIIKEKWNETYLSRFGIVITIIGYSFSIFDFTITNNPWIEIISIVVIVVIMFIVSVLLSERYAEVQYQNTDPEIFNKIAKKQGIAFFRR